MRKGKIHELSLSDPLDATLLVNVMQHHLGVAVLDLPLKAYAPKESADNMNRDIPTASVLLIPREAWNLKLRC
ncbi:MULTISPECIES: hypothetical protein [unclassified Duganella]|uniref:hypothetical protein n=1 Tax=unclassified Duganella TaxID=2636909 RepID=UPI001C3CE59A|nr:MULTISPECIES: hypothetical protein [unclassified Duganella]